MVTDFVAVVNTMKSTHSNHSTLKPSNYQWILPVIFK